jgi:hypothetical protein
MVNPYLFAPQTKLVCHRPPTSIGLWFVSVLCNSLLVTTEGDNVFEDFDETDFTSGLVVNLDALRNPERVAALCLGPIPWERDDYEWNEISPSDFFVFAYLAVIADAQLGRAVNGRLYELRNHYLQWLETGYFGGVLNFNSHQIGDDFRERFELVDGYWVPPFVEQLFKRSMAFLAPFHGEQLEINVHQELWKVLSELPVLDHLVAAFVAENEYQREVYPEFFMDTQINFIDAYKNIAGMLPDRIRSHWHRFDETSDEFTEDESSDY